MKHVELFFVFALITNLAFAQSPEGISDTVLVRYKQEIQKESQKLRQELLNKENLYDCDKQITVDFQIDTFLIERLLNKRVSSDYSTAAMTQTAYDSEKEYDKLLNKYYQLLLKKLNDSDKELLKQSQRNWIRYRESERKLNTEISKDEYSGGGTIQQIFIADGYAEITKKRVIELFHYLSRISE